MPYLPQWQYERGNGQLGLVTGCDKQQEWMLPWWWERYSAHNTYPVVFADFGMSDSMLRFCKSKGTLAGLGRRSGTRAWFGKPFALLACPYTKVVWVDLDCEVRGNLGPLFAYAEGGKIGLTWDTHRSIKDCVASGVVVAENGNKLVEEWARRCLNPGRLRGDQEVLNELGAEYRKQFNIMPATYQWLRLDGDNPKALIMHWTGPRGKDAIRQQMGKAPSRRESRVEPNRPYPESRARKGHRGRAIPKPNTLKGDGTKRHTLRVKSPLARKNIGRVGL